MKGKQMTIARKQVPLTLGTVTTLVTVHTAHAPQKAQSKLVCEEHLAPIRYRRTCDDCGDHAPKTILNPPKLAKPPATKALRLRNTTTEGLIPGPRQYWVVPDDGHEIAYTVIAQQLRINPSVVTWSPRVLDAEWEVTVHEGVILLSELVTREPLDLTTIPK